MDIVSGHLASFHKNLVPPTLGYFERTRNMKLFSHMKAKFVELFSMGDLIADLGTLTTDEHGREMSMSIRRYPGKTAHLQVKYDGGDTLYFQITRTREWADQFERVAQELRRRA